MGSRVWMRCGRAGLLAAGLTAVGLWVPSGSASAASATLFPSTNPAGFYPNAATVPAGICFVTIRADGGHGGAVASQVGGAGAFVTARVGVTPGATLTVEVGGLGGSAAGQTGGVGGLGGGGGAGGGFNVDHAAGGGGAGASAVSGLSGVLVVAGGGGGAGETGGGGAAGTLPASNPGANGSGLTPGIGGST